MTSLDVRNNSAAMKRAEQLKRWEESDTNRAPPTPRPERGRKIKFSSGCVFLASCLSGDKEEVIKLIESGADINTANVDGLTALHQACIDDNLEMVEFLIEHGADINRQDNEGWTPLHATASCGFVSIARYLVEHGADVAAVNSDGDLAIDLAHDTQHSPMIDFMQKVVNEHKIDCEKARQVEEELMLSDAKKWLRSDASEIDRPHPKTGATALHVAAAKGYTKVLGLLLAGRANVDKQDNDGWTPLHAAAHWSQKEAAEMLVDAMADMDVRNYAGQTPIDVADRKMVKFLEELRANNKRVKRRPPSQIRISDTIENHIENTPTKIIRVEVKPDQSKEQSNEDKPKSMTTDTHKTQQNAADAPVVEDETPWRRNSAARARLQNESPTKNHVPEKDVSKTNATAETSDVILRRTQSFENDEKFYQKYHELRARIKANSCPILPATQLSNNNNSNNNNNNNNNNNSNSNNLISNASVLGNVNNATTTTTTTTTTSTIQNYTVQRSASLKDHRNFRKPTITASPTAAVTTATAATTTTATTTSSSSNTTPIRRSFVPPVRDEESETQRKAHAKRVRETRRSTQGVTLDEIKSAEELVKKKNSTAMINNNNNSSSNTQQEQQQQQQEQEQQPPAPTTPPPTIETTPAAITTSPTRTASDKHIAQPDDDDDDDNDNDDDDDITASFTIVAPLNNRNRTATTTATAADDVEKQHECVNIDADHAAGSDDDNDEEVSATFTMTSRRESHTRTPTPTETVETTIVVPSTPPAIIIDEGKPNDKQSAAAPANNENQKTDVKPEINRAAAKNNESPIHERVTRGNIFSPLPLQDTASTTTTNTSSNTSTPTLDSPVRLRDKRSLFDLDNASSLRLAEKLRTEANKYSSEEQQQLNTAAQTHDNSSGGSSRRSLDSASLPTSPSHNRESGSGGHGGNAAERRPSWRLKFDAGCKFKLEDASSGNTYPPNNSTIIPSAPAVLAAANLTTSTGRRINSVGNAINASNQSLNSIGRPVSAPAVNAGDSSTNERIGDSNNSSVGAYSSRRPISGGGSVSTGTNTGTTAISTATVTTATSMDSKHDDKDNDKENDNRSALATQAVIQRRRKPKRRSTGVVHLDMDDLDPERHDSPNDVEEKESGSERNSRSRLASTASTTASTASNTDDTKSRDKTENGGPIDYKALWEASQLENEKLKQQLKHKDEELVNNRATLERITNATTKNSLSEIEKRERRALERKISEMEEELKLLQKLKTENERLRAENRALTRVVSKLTTSAQNQLSKSK